MQSVASAVFSFILVSVHIVCYIWLLLRINEKWWGVFIPFYNMYQFTKIAGKPRWWMWLLVPLPAIIIINVTISIMTYQILLNSQMFFSRFFYLFPVIIISVLFFIFSYITFIRLNIYLAKSFNKGIAFGIGLTLIPPLFILILALDKGIYQTYKPSHHIQEAGEKKIDIVQKNWNRIGFVLSFCLILSAGLAFLPYINNNPRIPESSLHESPVYEDPHTKYQYFNSIRIIRGLTSDATPKTFHAEVSLGYKLGRVRIQSELIERKKSIENIIHLYLGSKKANELSSQNAKRLQTELKNKINAILIEKIDLCLFKELQVF